MKKGLVATAISFVAVMTIVHGEFSVAVLNFLLAGVIPGTSTALPSWVMLVLYCLIITVIATLYIESVIVDIRERRAAAGARRTLPRRRYSQI